MEPIETLGIHTGTQTHLKSMHHLFFFNKQICLALLSIVKHSDIRIRERHLPSEASSLSRPVVQEPSTSLLHKAQSALTH